MNHSVYRVRDRISLHASEICTLRAILGPARLDCKSRLRNSKIALYASNNIRPNDVSHTHILIIALIA